MPLSWVIQRTITSGGLGTMGYGLPAAIGAKLGNPEKEVIPITGDGGKQMNIQELATAALYELPIIICILNNGYLGNVRQWQEMFYQRRYSSTCMRYRKSCPASCASPGEECPPLRSRLYGSCQKLWSKRDPYDNQSYQ